MNPSNPNEWTKTAIEYAVMKALNINGYQDILPTCGYSEHACMVVDPSCQDQNNPEFCDFTVISDPSLFNHYIRKALKSKRITLNSPSGSMAELVQGDTVIQNNATDNFQHNACLAILSWFEVRSVPMSVHSFEKELAEFSASQTT